MTATVARKRSALTKGQLPKFAPYIVLAVALVVAAAIMALIGFNAFGWGIVAAILFAVGLVSWSGAVEGALDRATERVHRGNRRNGDERGDQAVFDGGGALVVLHQLANESHGPSPWSKLTLLMCPSVPHPGSAAWL